MSGEDFYNSYNQNLYATSTVVSTSAISMLQAGTSQMSSTIISSDQVDSGVSTAISPQATGAATRQGKTTYDNTVAGYILGFDPNDGNAKFYIGNTTSYLNWNGSSLTIVGNISATTGSIGGFTIGATTISGGTTLILDSTGTGTITGGIIQTSTTGSRVQIGTGNDISMFDASTGGGGTISGDTASIKFIKDSDNTKLFTMQKRAGKDSTNDNVFELFASAPPTGYHNFIFIGEDGTGAIENVGTVSISANLITSESQNVNNGNIQMGLSQNSGGSFLANIIIRDVRAIYGDNAKSGTATLMMGSGTDGFAGIGWRVNSNTVNIGFYQNSSNLILGLTMLPDTNNAYDIGATGTTIKNFYCNAFQATTTGRTQGNFTSEANIEAFTDITVGRILKLGQVARATAEAIANPQNGWMYYDTTNNVIRVYINGVWTTK